MGNNFITNVKDEKSLKSRIKKLVNISEELKFLVGFFYFSGWKEIYESLKENREVALKILVGLDVDKHLSNIVEFGNKDNSLSVEEYFSQFVKSLGYAINNAEMDNEEFYTQVHFFIELLEQGRLIVKKTLNPNHAKLYLFKVKENSFGIDAEFITGSSNLTKAGLSSQNEFNVEIRDYGFEKAQEYFDSLWDSAVPITENADGKKIVVDFLKNRTQASLITPYEAYSYILKTYIELQESKRLSSYIDRLFEKNGFKKYTYQLDAVNQALGIINTYNGVIIADVVGLGKSVIASLIAKQLGKRGVVICPPGLIGNRHDNTGWWEYLNKFELYDWDIESSGKIEELADSIMDQDDLGYEVVIVDEAHRFRNQDTAAYDALANICRGKQVILLTATPFNNSPSDIFSLLKLFLVPGESGITIENDLEGRFSFYKNRFNNLSFILKNHNSPNMEKLKKAEKLYKDIFNLKPPIDTKIVKYEVNKMANEIKGVISPITIRRNRLDLKNDFEYKQEIQDLSEVEEPKEIFYKLTKEQSEFYDNIIKNYFGENGRFKGAIYKPFEYEFKAKKSGIKAEENRAILQQRNLYDFMRRLLVKRFESSFGAFKDSIERFLKVHKMVKEFIELSGKYILDRKIIESIYNDEDDAESFAFKTIEETLEKFRQNAVNHTSPKHTKIYEIKKFHYKNKFLNDIQNDIDMFKEIKNKVEHLKLVEKDPKKDAVLKQMQSILEKNKKRKIVLFSEYTDTISYLKRSFENEFDKRVLFCDGGITKKLYTQINENFNAQYKPKKKDFDILITSDKLSEGVNLNRAGAVINYDIPWNPTRVIQRLGRINRIGTKVFDKLYIYNSFPTEKGASIVKSREIASQKMFLIHNALGEDAKIFEADEEPSESGLFKKINSIPKEDEDISTLTMARNEFQRIKEDYPEVIDKVNNLPNRIKTAKAYPFNNTLVLRKKGVALFSMLGEYKDGKTDISEITFEEMLKFVKCDYDEKRLDLSKRFWESYKKIKEYNPKRRGGRSDIALEQKAINSLKSLLKQKDTGLDQNLMVFVNTLLRDLKKYKTLSQYTLRSLVLNEDRQNGYEKLIENIKQMKIRMGDDYLDIIVKRISNIRDDIIIGVENRSN